MEFSNNIKPIFLVLFCLTLISACQTGVKQDDVQQVIDQVGSKYVPDHRLGVWDINMKTETDKLILEGETTSPKALNELQRKLNQEYPDHNIAFTISLLPDDVMGNNHWGIVRVAVAHVRRSPGNKAEMITQTLMGAPVELLKEKSGYYYGKMEDGYLGWIKKFSVVTGDQIFLNEWKNDSLGVYRKTSGHILKNPKTSSMPVSNILLGGRVKIMDHQGSWTQVELPDRRKGFIKNDNLYTLKTFQHLQPDPNHLVHLARKLLGITYTWGGTSTYGFDCSGFTQTVYKMNGVQLPRDANMQVEEGVPVDTSNHFQKLRAGDLLFFGSSNQHITHVGMYIGDMEFIHSSGMVKINSLNPDAPNFNAYRRKNLRIVKRVFDTEPKPGKGRVITSDN